jgi:toxin CptA
MKPVQMVLRPALKLAYLLALVTLAACVVLLLLPLHFLLKAGLALLILLVAVYLIARNVLLILPYSWASLVLNAQDEIVITQQDGKFFVCRILPDSVVFSYCTILRLKLSTSWFARNLVLVPESADAETLRRWRIWLRWGMRWGHSNNRQPKNP